MKRRLPVFFLVFFLITIFCDGQENDRLSPVFHKSRREALRNLLSPSSAAIIFSNPTRIRSNDVDFQYSQNPDLYYLCGYPEPDGMLFISKEKFLFGKDSVNEMLIVRDRNASDEIWHGNRLGIGGAIRELGISNVITGQMFMELKPEFRSLDKVMVLYPVLSNFGKDNKPGLFELVEHFRSLMRDSEDKIDSRGLSNLMAKLREVKQPEEIELLKKAVNMTCEGFSEMIRCISPGMTEYQAQGIVEYFMKIRGAEYPGYPSISGAGKNSCVLHYTSNRKELNDGDLLLCDMGGEYHGYTADVTRTVPVNGKFSEEQLIIYNLVLDAQKAGIAASLEGNAFKAPHNKAREIISAGLKNLGIINSESQVTVYFMHGTSHYLGLDVHDAGTYGPLKAGSVITVEPGIYIPPGSDCDQKWWNIGVRIEDDILITSAGPVNLSGTLPREAAEIEKLMAEPCEMIPFNR